MVAGILLAVKNDNCVYKVNDKFVINLNQIFFASWTVLWSDNRSTPFGIPRVMEAIKSVGCNWWNNMHQIDALLEVQSYFDTHFVKNERD